MNNLENRPFLKFWCYVIVSIKYVITILASATGKGETKRVIYCCSLLDLAVFLTEEYQNPYETIQKK